MTSPLNVPRLASTCIPEMRFGDALQAARLYARPSPEKQADDDDLTPDTGE